MIFIQKKAISILNRQGFFPIIVQVIPVVVFLSCYLLKQIFILYFKIIHKLRETMFGFVSTEEKQKFFDNNDLENKRKKRERNFIISYVIFALALLNITLYFLTRSN